MAIDGALGAALVDLHSGVCLSSAGSSELDMELAAAGNTEMINIQQEIGRLFGQSDEVEDILITRKAQYHLIRLFPSQPDLFLYVVLSREATSLAMARLGVNKITFA